MDDLKLGKLRKSSNSYKQFKRSMISIRNSDLTSVQKLYSRKEN